MMMVMTMGMVMVSVMNNYDDDGDSDDKVGYWRWAMRWLDKTDENNNNIKGREVR